ncbi:hypothetical protein [Ancylobacter amanitiformis]|uniref:ABC-type nitrate/sulfonate/bicarbonate transport system ATPase subunit n=1 Tax=Ancylobacter amanitiformis TaxID=217069 RepID=A0ABU0LXF2_9HYPH|nr:ABC-type nitrate/sulfonate/bicarbonate transport system ATPase subunit [Ancylobacter amanitiformis]
MGHFSMEKSAPAGSDLSGNQHHHVDEAIRLGDRILVMRDGVIAAEHRLAPESLPQPRATSWVSPSAIKYHLIDLTGIS